MRFTKGLVVVAGLAGAMVGCNKPPQRLNAPPQGHSSYPNRRHGGQTIGAVQQAADGLRRIDPVCDQPG